MRTARRTVADRAYSWILLLFCSRMAPAPCSEPVRSINLFGAPSYFATMFDSIFSLKGQRALANEWARQGVNVNAIAPGHIATANTAPLRRESTANRRHQNA